MQTGIVLLLLGILMLVGALLTLCHYRKHPLPKDFEELDEPKLNLHSYQGRIVSPENETSVLEKTVIVSEEDKDV